MEKSLIVIGAGVAGLAAGCCAQMNGYRSQIQDLHTIPGGLCTYWRRSDCIFDGGVRYLTGAAPQSRVHQLWDELGVLDHREVHGGAYLAIPESAGTRDDDGGQEGRVR